MDDDKFRSYGDRDPVAREGSEQTARGGIGDLLAELARLTGQGDPYGDGGRDGGSSRLGRAEDDTPPEQPFGVPNYPLCRESAASRRSRRGPPDVFPDPLARCGRPRLTKLTAPIVFTMLSRARAGGSSS
jgi:hypothetical protein